MLLLVDGAASGSDGAGVVVRRWYDAVVLGPTGDDSLRFLDEVARFYTEHGLWAAVLDVSP